MVTLKQVLNRTYGHGMVNLAEIREKCLAVVYMVMNLLVPYKGGYVAALEGFCAM
jgi:hypothetical protein